MTQATLQALQARFAMNQSTAAVSQAPNVHGGAGLANNNALYMLNAQANAAQGNMNGINPQMSAAQSNMLLHNAGLHNAGMQRPQQAQQPGGWPGLQQQAQASNLLASNAVKQAQFNPNVQALYNAGRPVPLDWTCVHSFFPLRHLLICFPVGRWE